MIQWGTVGEWVGGVGAVVAAAVPLVLYLLERKARIAAQAEARGLREAELERLATQQMRQISLRVGPGVAGDGHSVSVHNGSGMPIRSVVIRAFLTDDQAPSGKGGWLRLRTVSAIPAGEVETLFSSLGGREGPRFEVEFTDENDARWVIDSIGRRDPVDGDGR